jgi:hypothetical protein
MGETMKTIIVAFVAALSAAVGETILSYAMKRSGQVDVTESSHWVNLILSVVRNPYVFAGVLFLGVYFFLYLIALSWADLSFVLPLTAVSYIFAAFLALPLSRLTEDSGRPMNVSAGRKAKRGLRQERAGRQACMMKLCIVFPFGPEPRMI